VPDLLTSILSRAVPEVSIVKAKITLWPPTGMYSIIVHPDHVMYWFCFYKRYPHYKQIALRYGVKEQSVNSLCLEFPTSEGLVNWLFDVIEMPQGERRLLRLKGL